MLLPTRSRSSILKYLRREHRAVQTLARAVRVDCMQQ